MSKQTIKETILFSLLGITIISGIVGTVFCSYAAILFILPTLIIGIQISKKLFNYFKNKKLNIA